MLNVIENEPKPICFSLLCYSIALGDVNIYSTSANLRSSSIQHWQTGKYMCAGTAHVKDHKHAFETDQNYYDPLESV